MFNCLARANRDHVFEMPSMYAATLSGERSSIRPLRIECENVVERAEVVGRVIEASGRIVGILPIGKKSAQKDAPRFAHVNGATIAVSHLRMIAADLAPHVGHEVPFCVRFITGSKVVRAVFHGGVCCTCGQRLPDVRMVSKARFDDVRPDFDVTTDWREPKYAVYVLCQSTPSAAVEVERPSSQRL